MDTFVRELNRLNDSYNCLTKEERKEALICVRNVVNQMETSEFKCSSLSGSIVDSSNGTEANKDETIYQSGVLHLFDEGEEQIDFSNSRQLFDELDFGMDELSLSPFAADIGLELLQQTYNSFPSSSQQIGDLPSDFLEEKIVKKRRECRHCEQWFWSRRRLHAHSQRHFPRKIVCLLCGKPLKNREIYSEHLEKRHNRPRDVRNMRDDEERRGDRQRENGINREHRQREWRCEMCGFVAEYAKKLLRHRKSSGHFSVKETTVSIWNCENCEYKTGNRRNLERHKHRKHLKSTISCSLCSHLLIDRESLRRHMDTVHCGKEFKCEECEKRFATLSNLSRHTRSVHDKLRQFFCECGRNFQLGTHLKRHQEKNCSLRYEKRKEEGMMK